MELRIWELRRSKNLSIRELEELSGVSKSTINRLENNNYPPSILALEKIASALECSVKDLFKN